ncbi:NAD(P)-binding protein [Microthyrium microscopicum]|uniref:NAD(P)-binding protein n=1 Tax=Microthyrium microscopicum TaxID=703497 RepID=A0A6A6UDQ3_9PEZI|nr:NAD(P)-binding protein [Microthyrium microscopicum]
MASIRKVAIIGAGGNFGIPITKALRTAGFDLTIISRLESQTKLPDDIPVIRTTYDLQGLTAALRNQDAVVNVVGPAGLPLQKTMIDAAEAAGVQRFVLDDFGRAPSQTGLPDLEPMGASRREILEYARQKASSNLAFTWSAVAIGIPALKKFPTMGFDIVNRSAIIYDKGTEPFTGVTLAGIGQSVVGILQQPDQTANKHLCVQSLQTCQNEILEAFETVSRQTWKVKNSTSAELIARGRARKEAGEGVGTGSGGWPVV